MELIRLNLRRRSSGCEFFSSGASSSAFIGEAAGEKPSIMVVIGVEPQDTRVPKHRSMTL